MTDKKEVDVAGTPVSASTSSLTEDDEKAVLKAAYRKVDYRVLLWYSFVYLIMKINNTNITNTAIINVEEGDGIKEQLGNLTSEQWAWALSIFYYPYMVAEPASTLLLKRFTPSVWMSRIMVTWGIVSICQAATQNYAGILAARFFLGLAEAGFYPGVLYHISFWYPAEDTSLRIAFFYACGQFSGTISGLLAFAISYMNGISGLAGWRWMFIFEGIPPILCGIYTLFMLPNYIETSNFISEREKSAMLNNLPKTQPSSTSKTWNKAQFKAIFKDPITLAFIMTWIFHAIGGWGISHVLPTVIYDLGFSASAISQLLTMPTYAFGCASLVFSGWLIHTKRLRSWVAAIGLEILAMVCYVILIVVKNAIAKYILVTIALSCSICIYPILWPERIRAAHGTTAAGLTIGMTNAAAQLNGIVGPQVYQTKFGPGYRIPYAVSIALLGGAVVSIGITWWLVEKKEEVSEKDGDVGSEGSR